jgi:hypothetical protein
VSRIRPQFKFELWFIFEKFFPGGGQGVPWVCWITLNYTWLSLWTETIVFALNILILTSARPFLKIHPGFSQKSSFALGKLVHSISMVIIPC